MNHYRNSLFIDGEWKEPINNNLLEIINPSTGAPITEIGYGGEEDAVLAVETAEKAFGKWSSTSVRERADILNKVAELLRVKSEKIGGILAQETGKRLEEAIGEVKFSAEYFQWFAEEVRRPHGHMIPSEFNNKNHTFHTEPSGVALLLTPWNFPVSIQARKLAPALAAGCTVVARGSGLAPLSLIELFRCLEEAGLPHGVANLIQGPGAATTETMLKHPAVRVASFTGSTSVGKSIIKHSANEVVRLSLELGGDAPFIVFDDADINKAVEGAMVAKFRNNGQSCIGANRFYIHEKVYDEFVTLFVNKVEKMKVDNPIENSQADLGPVIDLRNKQRLENIIAEAEASGAKHLISKISVPSGGYYVPPVLMENVSEESSLGSDEVFGPIASINKFSEENEVLVKANNTKMGLCGYAYTNNISRSRRVQDKLKVGIMGLNNALPSVAYAPMGGVKHSGLGREGGRHGLEEFMDVKYVATEFDLE